MRRRNRPIRVGLLTPAFRCGGVEMFLFRLGRHLQGSGFDVELIATQRRGQWFEFAKTMGLRATHIPWYALSPGYFHARKIGRKLGGGDYDVLILNHCPYAQAAMGMLPDRVGVICILHNDIESEYRVTCGNKDAWNVLVAPGPKLLETARRRVPDRPVILLPHGVEAPENTSDRCRENAGKPFQLAYVGRLEQVQKQVLVLPEILQGCLNRGIDARLFIAGQGPDEGRLRQRCEELKLLERIRFLGRLQVKEVYELLLDSHALLLPSSYEGLPIVPLEAQACGCVPVCSRLPGITDYAVEDGRTGLLAEAGKVEQFVDAVASLDSDRSKWLAMCERGHRRILERFSVQVMGESYARLIRQVLDEKFSLPRPRSCGASVSFETLLWRDLLPAGIWRALRRLSRRDAG